MAKSENETVAASPRRLRSSEEGETAATPKAGEEELPGLPRGSTIGRYVVLEQLGHGAMGVVYAAYDPELDRKLAIKLVRAEILELSGRTRFLREAQAMAKLSHPNVVAIHDVGTIGEQVFIAMELVEGQTLREWQRAAPRRLDEVLAVYRQAGRGLHAAHAAGIVHRDFKPDNVLVGSDGRVRVADFGLARASDGSETDEPVRPQSGGALALSVTQTGTMLGTPAYMAPEQMRGDAAAEKTDQFSFCAALWEALYESRPYDGVDTDDLLRNLEAGRLREPSSGRKMPSWLRALLTRGLSPQAEQRHPSVGALLDQIERIPARAQRRRWAGAAVLTVAAAGLFAAQVQHARSTICRVGPEELAGSWNASRRAAVRAAFSSAGPAAAPALAATLEALDGYAQRWLAARTQACEATRVRGEQSEALLDLRMACLDHRRVELDAVTDLLAHADPSLVERGAETARSLTDLASCANTQALRARVQPPADGPTRARVDELQKLLARARAQYDAGHYAEAVAALRAPVEEAAGLHYRPLQAEILYLSGLAQRRLGDYKGAAAVQREAMVAAEEGSHDEAAALAAVAVMGIEGDASRYDDALLWGKLAQAWLARVGDAPAIEDNLQINLGNIYDATGHPAEARAAYQKALALREKELGPNDANLGQPLIGLGLVLVEEGHYDEASVIYRRALALQEKSLGASHTDVGMTLTNLGQVLIHQHHWEEARVVTERALAIFLQTLGPAHYFAAAAQANLAAIKMGQNEPVAAVALYRQAIAVGEKALGADNAEVASQRGDLARALRKLGRTREALSEAETALTVQEKSLGKKSALLVSTLVVLGQTQLDLGRAEAARVPLERALALATNDPDLRDEANQALARVKLAGAH